MLIDSCPIITQRDGTCLAGTSKGDIAIVVGTGLERSHNKTGFTGIEEVPLKYEIRFVWRVSTKHFAHKTDQPVISQPTMVKRLGCVCT